MKFRRRVKLFPGVTLNFSKTGISTTVGMPGASVNFNRQGTFLNTGIPGTGIYDRQRIGGKKKPSSAANSTPGQPLAFSKPNTTSIQSAVEGVTSEGLLDLQTTLLECQQEREEIKKDIAKAKSALSFSNGLLIGSYVMLIGFAVKWFKQNHMEKKEALADLQKQLSECFVPIDFQGNDEMERTFIKLHEAYKKLLTCDRIWDITSKSPVNQFATRSAATSTISRVPVRFQVANLEIISCRYDALHFENANGGDLYFYPGFMAIIGADHRFNLIDLRELDFKFITKKFVEEEPVPSDATIVGHTWSKVNKDGSPDRRFRDNYQIPICLYGELELKSPNGLDEAYSFSDHAKAKAFAEAFDEYQGLVRR